MTKTIKLSELRTDVENGMKKLELSAKYTDGNNAQLAKLLKQANLTIRKFRKASFILVDDTAEVSETPPSADHGFSKEEEAKMFEEVEA